MVYNYFKKYPATPINYTLILDNPVYLAHKSELSES